MSLFDKVYRVIFTLFFLKAITGRNFTMKGLHHGLFPANFERFLRFLPKHPQPNAFVPFRPLWDFTTVFKTVTIFLLLHCGSWPCAALRKQRSFDILSKQKPFTIVVWSCFVKKLVWKKIDYSQENRDEPRKFWKGGTKNFVRGWNMVT